MSSSSNRRTITARVDKRSLAISAIFGALTSLPAAFIACSKPAAPPPRGAAGAWHKVGSWTGRGNRQTEIFTSDTGAFRVTWETRNETSPGAGRLYAIFRSGDSGREIMDAVKAEGVG